MVTTNKKTRLVKWHKYTSPAESTLPHPFLGGTIACYLVTMGVANSEITIDLNKIDPNFSKLSPHGKRAFAHGVKQRLVDGTAGKSPSESYTIMRDMGQLLMSGSWFAARDTAAARRLNMLVTDMCVAKFTLKFTDDNRASIQEIVISADEEKIKSWLESPQVSLARADREAREAEIERKSAADKLKAAGKVELTF